jgi:hypothetical protein
METALIIPFPKNIDRFVFDSNTCLISNHLVINKLLESGLVTEDDFDSDKYSGQQGL